MVMATEVVEVIVVVGAVVEGGEMVISITVLQAPTLIPISTLAIVHHQLRTAHPHQAFVVLPCQFRRSSGMVHLPKGHHIIRISTMDQAVVGMGRFHHRKAINRVAIKVAIKVALKVATKADIKEVPQVATNKEAIKEVTRETTKVDQGREEAEVVMADIERTFVNGIYYAQAASSACGARLDL